MINQIDIDHDHSVSALHNRLFFRLFQVGNTLERQALKELGISSVQWAVFGALSRPKLSEGMLFSELADYLVVSRQSLDGVLKRLERDDHVVRVADKNDRRAKRVILTTKGVDFWLTLQPKIYDFYRQSLVYFRFDDKISFVHYINSVNEGMQKTKITSD
jgi:DNA-binding MarR family transcriptional regulator